MNKILRFSLFCIMALFCGTAFAQEVTLDFTTNTWGLPEGASNKGTDAAEYTNGTYTIRLEATNSGYYFNSNGYLMIGKTNATLTLPAFNFDVEKIEVVGKTGASASTKQNIFVGDNAVSEETTGSNTTNTYVINPDYAAAGNVYVFKVLSSHNAQITQINVYKRADDAKKGAGLAFSEQEISVEKGAEFTSPTFTKATTAAVTFSSDNEEVASVNSEGKISLTGGEGTAVITATSEANDEYEAGEATCTVTVFTYNTYKKATAITSGKAYLFVAQRDNQTMYAYPLRETYTYGYMNVSTIDELTETIRIRSTYDDGFVFTEAENGYTITDCYGRYMYNDGSHNTFNVGSEPQVWTVEAQADGTFKISMGEYFIQWGQGTYTTFGCWTSLQENAVLPYLYEEYNESSNIKENVAEQVNANAPIYNLAGQRVSKDTKGILIQNGKKFINR